MPEVCNEKQALGGESEDDVGKMMTKASHQRQIVMN